MHACTGQEAYGSSHKGAVSYTRTSGPLQGECAVISPFCNFHWPPPPWQSTHWPQQYPSALPSPAVSNSAAHSAQGCRPARRTAIAEDACSATCDNMKWQHASNAASCTHSAGKGGSFRLLQVQAWHSRCVCVVRLGSSKARGLPDCSAVRDVPLLTPKSDNWRAPVLVARLGPGAPHKSWQRQASS